MNIKDIALSEKVKAAIMQNRHLSTCQIKVTASEGKVILTGTVETNIQKEEAGYLASIVIGVKEIINDIDVVKLS